MENRGTDAGAERTMLLVDDDPNLCWTLQRTFESRGYKVQPANSVPQVLAILKDWSPAYAVVDIRLQSDSGLTLIPLLKCANPAMRIVVTTGYASIATAVHAIKLGATHYLAKPVSASVIEAAFERVSGDSSIPVRQQPVSVHRLAWEHIHGVLADHRGNVSAAARALGMHRRTLQRKLGKHPARS